MADHIEPLPSGEDSPWARDVPIPPPPFFPASWTTSRDGRTVAPTSVFAGPATAVPPTRDSDDPVVDQAPADAASGSSPPTARGRSVLVAGVIGVVIVAAIGAQLVGGRGSDPRGDATADGATATTLDATSDESSVPDTESPPSTAQRPSRPSSTVVTLPEPEPQWVTAPIELSPRMQAMTVPTEVIALAQNGTLYSISIPTGVVRSLDTGDRSSDRGLVIGQESIVIVTYNNATARLTRVGQPVTRIDVVPGVGQVLPRPGSDEFVIIPNQTTDARPTPFNMAVDGTLTPIVEGPLADVDGWRVRFLPTGELVVDDSGGLYVLDESGAARRISTGDLVAVGPNHYLTRECDDKRVCSYVRVEAATGDRTTVVVDVPAENNGYLESAGLSPDGLSMTSLFFGETGPKSRVMDLATGAVLETNPTSNNYGYNSTERIWAADSSGVFVVEANRLTFFDRATGESIAVAPKVDLGSIVAITARPFSEPAAP